MTTKVILQRRKEENMSKTKKQRSIVKVSRAKGVERVGMTSA